MSEYLKKAEEILRGLSDANLDEYYARSMRLMVDGKYRRDAKKHLTKYGKAGRVTNARVDEANNKAQDILVAEFTRRGRLIPTLKSVEAMFEEIVG